MYFVICFVFILPYAVDPALQRGIGNAVQKLSALPVSAAGVIGKVLVASADSAAARRAERNAGDTIEIVFLNEGVENARFLAPPDRVADKYRFVTVERQLCAAD